jgi:hypothetical protein
MRSPLKLRPFLMMLAVAALVGAALSSPAPVQAYDECYFAPDSWCYYDTGGWCHLACGETCQGDVSGQIIGCMSEGEVCCY